MARKVRALERPRVLALPDVSVALGVNFKIEPTFLIENVGEPWIIAEQARKDGGIAPISLDPVLPIKAFFDIGGAGAKADAMAIWIVQFVSREIRILDYIEGVGQPLGFYATELRRRGWKDAIIHLPHDGVARNNISGKRYVDHWAEAGFDVATPIKNSGAGAAMMRIEAARRIFPRCWFNEKPTDGGLELHLRRGLPERERIGWSVLARR